MTLPAGATCTLKSEIKGIKMAVEEINAKGGILGKKLEYIIRDTEGKTDVAVREVKDLILREKVNFLIGPCSSGTGLAMQVVHSEYKVLRLSAIANTEAQTVDKFSPYFVQVVPNTYMEAVAATRYFQKKVPKAKKFATIGPDYDFGRREEMAFTEEIKKLVPDAEIVYEAWPKLGRERFYGFYHSHHGQETRRSPRFPFWRGPRVFHETGGSLRLFRKDSFYRSL